ncbi:MAG TPA: cupin domain-containing protein [Paenirhodobacter sp.]
MGKIEEIIAALHLEPHRVAGWFAPSFRERTQGHRADMTAIYYLLCAGDELPKRKLDSFEIWHFYDGAPVEVTLTQTARPAEIMRLGRDLIAGERPQIAIPAYFWQSCRTLGEWSLVGCTTTPGYSSKTTRFAEIRA